MKTIFVLLFVILILSVAYLGYDKYKTDIKLKKSIQKNERDFDDFNFLFLEFAALSSSIDVNPVGDDRIIIPSNNKNSFNPMNCLISSYRNYTVAFAVTKIYDFETKDTIRLKKLLELINVENASYSVFYNDSKDLSKLPKFDFDPRYIRDNIKKFKPNQILNDKQNNKWTFISYRELNLDKNTLFESIKTNIVNINTIPFYPIQLQNSIGPIYDLDMLNGSEHLYNFDSIFYYNHEKTIEYNNKNIDKRIFQVKFQPPYQAGWYKLIISSETNRVLDISNHYFEPFEFDIGYFNVTLNSLNWFMDSLYKKIEKYNIPDYRKVIVRPHYNSNLDSFYLNLNQAILNTKLSEDSNDYKYLKSYNELVKYVLPKMNKLNDCKSYIDYNIFVRIPEPAKSKK